MDPNSFFNQMANGKEVITRSEIPNEFMQRMFDRIAERTGVTNGQITREQFTTYMTQRMAERGGGAPPSAPGQPPSPGGPSAGGAPSGPPGQSAPDPNAGGSPPGNGNSPDAWSSWADGSFRRMDQNGDGLLNYDEMSEELRVERDKWDADHNGLIDLNEYKAYFQARMQQRMAERGASGFGSPGLAPGPFQAEMAAPAPEEEPKPVVYRTGKLPKDLPSWFNQLDTDGDAQIGLYEWKASGRSVDEFQAMDRNGDGFLTVQEILRYTALAQKNPAGGSPSGGGSASGGGPSFGGFASGGAGGFGRSGFGGPPSGGPGFGNRSGSDGGGSRGSSVAGFDRNRSRDGGGRSRFRRSG